MPKTMDEAVQLLLGAKDFQIASQQIEIERLQEENKKLQKDLNDMLTRPPSEKEPA